MGVKSIFKILFTTMVGMVLSMLLIEIFNVSIASYQLRQICRMAARQSCILFTSETYKGTSNDGGSIRVQNIYDSEGNLYLTGNFYGRDPSSPTYKQDVWNDIYNSSDFRDFCNGTLSGTSGTSALNKYYTLPILLMAAENNIPNISVNWSSSAAELEAAAKAETARMYRANYYTTNNIGIPYMDKTIVNRMYQWNLAQLLSNCNPDSIQRDGIWEETDHGVEYDPNSQMCVNFMGFRIYANQCTLNNFEYKVYDVSDVNPSRESEAERVWEDLNIDVTQNAIHSIGLSNHRNRQGYAVTTVGGNTVYDNQYITAVGLNYNLVATYEGITPLRNIIAFVFNSQVSGFSRDGSGVNTPPDLSGTPEANIANGPASSDTISLGGFNGNNQADGSTSGLVVSSGKLVYTLDR